MPIRDDLILRMLDQIGEVAARVLTGRVPGALHEAERELASAYRELTGSGRALVARLSSEQLLAILGAPSRFNRERGYLLARLLEIDASLADARLREAGEADDAAGARASADVDRLKALDLYLEAALAGLDEDDLDGRIAALAEALTAGALPRASHWRRFAYAEARGRFADAEDLLFEGLERFGTDDDVTERGRAFYRGLHGRTDAELEAGALPRDEVAEGRDAFERELGRVGAPGAG